MGRNERMGGRRRMGGMDTAANTRGVMKASSGRAAGRTLKVLLMVLFTLATYGMYAGLGDVGAGLAVLLWCTLLLGRWTLGKW